MKVAIVCEPYIPVPPVKYGGTELIIYYLIKGLQEQGHEPVLLAAGDSNVDCELIPIIDKAIYFPTKKKDLPSFKKKVEKVHEKTAKELRKLQGRVDIIHSHHFDLKNFQYFPNLTTLHGPIDLIDLQYYLERKNLFFVSISQAQQAGCPELQYMGTVYNGLDTSKFPVVTEPEDYVCFLGRFDREKNPHLAILLAINLGIKIKVAGKIDHQGDGYFEHEVAKYFDHPLVEYLGELAFDEKIELVSKAKCNLHPTGFREPFGLTVLEAAYCGTPTLAIAKGSMPELIEEGRTGVLVEDFVEGYHYMKSCFDMDRTYISDRARALFNYKTMTKQYIKAYQEVMNTFTIRNEQDQLIEKLTKHTKEEIAEIWQAHKNQLKHKINQPPKSKPASGNKQRDPLM